MTVLCNSQRLVINPSVKIVLDHWGSMKLLVGFDGSKEAEEALAYATDIAEATNGSITAVHAVDPSVYDQGGSETISGLSDADDRLVIESVERAEERGLKLLDEAVELAETFGRTIETELLHGDPVRAITDYAEEKGLDTIVLGHRGRSERTDLMLGSVAKQIVERATIPVIVVR